MNEGDTAAEIYKLLPGRDCGEKSPCGLPKCMLFAKALLKGRDPYDCPYMEDEDRQQVILVLEDYFR